MKPREKNRTLVRCEEGAEAFIFDLDGVITDTAKAHADAWKKMFDAYLASLEERRGEVFDRFDREDYRQYVDGKPRYDGVRSFLASRGIELETGSPDDAPERETVCGLGNRKNALYREHLDRDGVEVYPEAPGFVRRLRSKNIKTAVVSSSKNCQRVLEVAGIADLFEVRVDGRISEDLGLDGKPAPDIFLKAAEDLDVAPERAVVVEDAISGVQAGRRGGFGCVIGVDRTGSGRKLIENGADRVVRELTDLDPGGGPQRRSTISLPSALDHIRDIGGWRDGKQTALFLDYDGTLTPIVERPEQADLDPRVRATLKNLSGRCTVAIVSGRGLNDVRRHIALDGLYYAGSHGFEIEGPGQERIRSEKGSDALPQLDEAENQLRSRLAEIEGALVERKKYSVAVHYRRVADELVEKVEKEVDEVLEGQGGLRKGYGKKVFELQPDVDWNKGRAVLWLMTQLDFSPETVRPIYIGDDVTDEDAFRALPGQGAGIVVHGGEDRPSYARYGLVDPEEVRTFLQRLSAAIDGGE